MIVLKVLSICLFSLVLFVFSEISGFFFLFVVFVNCLTKTLRHSIRELIVEKVVFRWLFINIFTFHAAGWLQSKVFCCTLKTSKVNKLYSYSLFLTWGCPPLMLKENSSCTCWAQFNALGCWNCAAGVMDLKTRPLRHDWVLRSLFPLECPANLVRRGTGTESD